MRYAISFRFEKHVKKNPISTAAKQTLIQIAADHGLELKKVAFTFMKDEALWVLNQQHLNHHTYTDILTFDYSTEHKGKRHIYGEIFISIERVAENAVLFEQSMETELMRVVFHGMLHLCGYKDKTASQKKQMREQEDYYLKLFATYSSQHAAN